MFQAIQYCLKCISKLLNRIIEFLGRHSSIAKSSRILFTSFHGDDSTEERSNTMNEHYGNISKLLDDYINTHDVTFDDFITCLKAYIKAIGKRVISRKLGDSE